jgi:alpha-methylacyl-CoA racemase
LLKGLNISPSSLPGPRHDHETWPFLRRLFTGTFLTKTRAEWEQIFDGTDACCTPVLTNSELEASGFEQRPAVTLKSSPGFALHKGPEGREPAVGQGKGIEGNGWSSEGLMPGEGGQELLAEWVGWRHGREFVEVEGGLELADRKAKL